MVLAVNTVNDHTFRGMKQAKAKLYLIQKNIINLK